MLVFDAPLHDQIVDLLEMSKLFPCQSGQSLQKFRSIHISIQQTQRRACSLFFAVGVIDEELIEVIGRLLKPAFRRPARQERQHGL